MQVKTGLSQEPHPSVLQITEPEPSRYVTSGHSCFRLGFGFVIVLQVRLRPHSLTCRTLTEDITPRGSL